MTISQQGIDRVSVHGVRDRKKRERIRREFFSTAPPNMYEGARELHRTSFEEDLYYATCAAFLRFLDEFGLPRRWIPPLSRVHIHSMSEYKIHIDATSGGLASHTHVYLVRRRGAQHRRIMALDMTHEIAHTISFQTCTVTVDGRNRRITMPQSGLLRYAGRNGARTSFFGLNEGTTEWLARFVRWRINRHSSLLSSGEKRWLSKTVVYPIHVRLVEELCSLLIHRGVTDAPFHLLFRDYLYGTNHFLEAVERIRRGTALTLRLTDKNPSSALNALRAFGFHKVAKQMEQCVDDDQSEL